MIVTYAVQGWTKRNIPADKTQYGMTFDRAQKLFNRLIAFCEIVVLREEAMSDKGWSVSKVIAGFERG